jgi:hypothetical protein
MSYEPAFGDYLGDDITVAARQTVTCRHVSVSGAPMCLSTFGKKKQKKKGDRDIDCCRSKNTTRLPDLWPSSGQRIVKTQI